MERLSGRARALAATRLDALSRIRLGLDGGELRVETTALDYADAAPLPARRALAEVIELKTRAEDHLKASGLDYTIIRPGGLTDRGATGQAFLAADPEAFSYISRTDLAALSVAALGDPATIGKTYAAYDPTRKTLWKMFND
jgi:uncharacterized protein YbjT (DUF2867 family)